METKQELRKQALQEIEISSCIYILHIRVVPDTDLPAGLPSGGQPTELRLRGQPAKLLPFGSSRIVLVLTAPI